MEQQRPQDLIVEVKSLRVKYHISFPRILAKMEEQKSGGSLSTLRRVFADNSEKAAATFGYETILLPIRDAVRAIVKEIEAKGDNPAASEIEALQAVIHCQNEEINRISDMNGILENRISFLLEQIEKKDRRMDEKDDIINRLLDQLLVCKDCPRI